MRYSSLILAVLLLFTGVARADGPFDFQQAASAKRSHNVRYARSLRNAGIAISVAGVVVEATTIVMWSLFAAHGGACGINLPCTDTPAEQKLKGDLLQSAWATTGAAPALLGIGIPMWAVGQKCLQTVDDQSGSLVCRR
jgi:hypothetical protein